MCVDHGNHSEVSDDAGLDCEMPYAGEALKQNYSGGTYRVSRELHSVDDGIPARNLG